MESSDEYVAGSLFILKKMIAKYSLKEIDDQEHPSDKFDLQRR